MRSVRASWPWKPACASKRSRGGCRRRVLFQSCRRSVSPATRARPHPGQVATARIRPAGRPRRDWSIEEKIRILAKASPLTGAELMELLAHQGVLQAEYEHWRLALREEGRLPWRRRSGFAPSSARSRGKRRRWPKPPRCGASLGVSGPESSPEKSAPARVRHQRRVRRGEPFSRGWHVCSAYDGRRSAAGLQSGRDIGP
jgi:hypothetical protein